MTDAADLPIYPRYCFHLAPTVNTWCLLRAVEVHALDQYEGFEGENFFFYRNLPIKWVRVVGVVVSIDEFWGRRVYTVDDSSGTCIECMVAVAIPSESNKTDGQAKQPQPPLSTLYENIDVGCVVDVKGGLSIFRNEKQITIEKMVHLRSTEQELVLWEKRLQFRKEVLDKPWVLRNRDIRNCRKEAERTKEETVQKKRRSSKVTMEGGMNKRAVKHHERLPVHTLIRNHKAT